jgi:hypothetical protein
MPFHSFLELLLLLSLGTAAFFEYISLSLSSPKTKVKKAVGRNDITGTLELYSVASQM